MRALLERSVPQQIEVYSPEPQAGRGLCPRSCICGATPGPYGKRRARQP